MRYTVRIFDHVLFGFPEYIEDCFEIYVRSQIQGFAFVHVEVDLGPDTLHITAYLIFRSNVSGICFLFKIHGHKKRGRQILRIEIYYCELHSPFEPDAFSALDPFKISTAFRLKHFHGTGRHGHLVRDGEILFPAAVYLHYPYLFAFHRDPFRQ